MLKGIQAVAAAVCGLCVLAFSSCTVNQAIVIAEDGSGTFDLHVDVAPLLRDYLASLADLSGNTGPLKEGKVFDAAAIRKEFQARPGIVVQKASTPASNVLDLGLGFETLSDLLGGQDALKDAEAIALVDEGGSSTLRLHLDRTTWAQLARLFPPLRDPLVAELGPQANGQVTDDDYLSMVRFSIGDTAPALLRKSFVTLSIQPNGRIISQSGGTLKDGAVTFRIPLLRILVLDRPLDYAVTWERPV